MKQAWPYLLLSVALLLFLYVVPRIFLDQAIEESMGTAQKIFYFHLPLAWIMMLFAVVSGIAAGVELRTAKASARALAIASADMVLLAGAGVLISGPIWGNATWGTPWTGDARLITTALLWLVFLSYWLVQRYGPSSADRLAAALAIFGALDVPIIYYSVKIWKTTHPKADVVKALPASMWGTLWPALCALLCVAVALVWIRTRQERLSQELDQLWIRSQAGEV